MEGAPWFETDDDGESASGKAKISGPRFRDTDQAESEDDVEELRESVTHSSKTIGTHICVSMDPEEG